MARPGFVRSLQAELIDGATDGALKKAKPNWGVAPHTETLANRSMLHNGVGGYGIEEAGEKALKILKGVVRGL
jgi:hypothetical protein